MDREETAVQQDPPRMTAGRAALLGLMRRYLAAAMDPAVSLLEIHKLMYFMQEAGEPLRLRFQKGIYGPYAENLRHVLSHIDGHFISGYGDPYDRPDKQIGLSAEAGDQAESFLGDHPDTQARFDRVARLIEGFETPYGMELLACVHWVATRDSVSTPDDAVAKIYAWNKRRRMFDEQRSRIAWDVLASQDFLRRPGT